MASAMSPTTLDATIEKMSESHDQKENGATTTVEKTEEENGTDEVFKENGKKSKTDEEPQHHNVSGHTLTQAEVEDAQKVVRMVDMIYDLI